MLVYHMVPKSPPLNPAVACSWLCKVCLGLISFLGGCPPHMGTSVWAAPDVWLLHIPVGVGLGVEGGLESGAMGIHMVLTNFKGEELFSSHIPGTEENGCC